MNPGSFTKGPGVVMKGMTPGSQEASVEYLSETAHAVRAILALRAVELTLDMTVDGVQYIPPTGSTDNACRGEPWRGETLMSDREFASVGGRLAGTSGLCVCWSASGGVGGGRRQWGRAHRQGEALAPTLIQMISPLIPGHLHVGRHPIHCSSV